MIEVTEAVYDKVADLIIEENNPEIVGLRVGIQGGGCSGFQYQFGWATALDEGDEVLESEEGLKIIIDPISYVYLDGSVIDYVRSVGGEHISIKNPQAQTQCGCGSSFGV